MSSDMIGECIKIVSEKYGSVASEVDPSGSSESLINCKDLGSEYASASVVMNGCYSGYSLQCFIKTLLLNHERDFPEMSKLAEIALCIPVSTAACERGFSLQNRLKNKLRNCLSEVNLEYLMKLACGPELKDYPFEKAICHWRDAKKRRLGRLYTVKSSRK